MEAIQGVGSAAAELLQAQTGLWSHIFNHIDSMSLKCAVELGIPDVIHHYGRPISLLELSAALGVHPTKSSHLRRIMRVLTNSGVFSSQSSGADGDGEVYLLTPLSRLLVKDKGEALSPFLLAMLDPVIVTPFQYMGAWFRGEKPTPFAMAHGCGLWDKADQSPEFNKTFNAGMASDACFLADVLVTECGNVFRGLRSMVDVGGGTGSAAKAIAKTFPQVKCSVLELPHVVDAVPETSGIVEFVAGDMFDYIPPADAVLLKWILHGWSDEDCVKILQRCKEAIPCKEEGGKVIIVDLVVGSENSHPKSRETQLYWDMMMFVVVGGAEREEHEWRKIFTDAGFTDYKITPTLGLRSVIEVYP